MQLGRFAATSSIVYSLAIGLVGSAGGADNSYLPDAGGAWSVPANWSLGHCPIANEAVRVEVSGNAHKVVTYNWLGASTFSSVRVDGDGTTYRGEVDQPANLLTTYVTYLGAAGDALYRLEGPAYLWVNELLYVGYQSPGRGFFRIECAGAGSGLYVGNIGYVGYSGEGQFDHVAGAAEFGHLYVGQNAPGQYLLSGEASGSLVSVEYNTVIGNGDVGMFEQSGGAATFDAMLLGLNTGGSGTYLMRGGSADAHHVSIAWNGDGFFTQTGGAVTTLANVNIGCEGTHPSRAWYKLSSSDGPATLTIGGDMLVGPQTLAKYEQMGGTATVAGNIEIFDGDASPGSSSFVYMGLNAGSLTAAALLNHSGYFDQDGGVLEVQSAVNDSPQGMNLDNNADCRIRTLTHNAGTLRMWRNAILRGPRAFGNTFWICDFTNNATFQMGSAGSGGGSFRGHLLNKGTFDYYQGDFAQSRLTNDGVFNMLGDFTCVQLINDSSLTVAGGRTLTAGAASYATAIENNGVLRMQPGARISLAAGKPLVNRRDVLAGGTAASAATIFGSVDNRSLLIPSASAATGVLTIDGAFAGGGTSELRIRLGGIEAGTTYDRLAVTGATALSGELKVLLVGGFVPELGDRFYPVTWGSPTGYFTRVSLPALPPGLAWDTTYGTTSIRLAVVAAPACPADLDRNDRIDLTDLAILLTHFGGPANRSQGDIDGDSLVTLTDLSLLLMNFGSMCP